MSIQWIPVRAALATGTNFIGLGGGGNQNVNATEAIEQAPFAAPGSLLSMVAALSAAPGVGNSYRIQVSINGSASTVLDFTISDGAVSASLTGSITIAAGDLITIKTISSGSPATPNLDLWLAFQPTTTDHFVYFGGSAVNQLNSAPQFMGPLYGLNGQVVSGTETEQNRNVVPFAGTLNAYYVSMQTAPGVGNSWDLRLTQNNSEVAATALNISGTNKVGNVTGLSTAIAAGDYLSFKVKTDTTANATRAMNCGVCIIPTAAGLFALGGADNGASISTSVQSYGLIGMNTQNNVLWGTTESAVQRAAPAVLTLSALYVRSATAPGGVATYTFAPRKNAADSGITAVITGAGLTGNGSGTDSIALGDLIDIRETPAGGPASITDVTWALAAKDTTGVINSYTTFGVVTREIDVSKWSVTNTFYFEAVIAAGAGTCHARLFNVTDNTAVAGSDITTTSATAARVRSAAITLSGDKTYRVEFGGAPGNTYYCYAGDVIIDTTG